MPIIIMKIKVNQCCHLIIVDCSVANITLHLTITELINI